MQIQRRLSWECFDLWKSASMVERYGKECWPNVDFDAIEPWHKTSVTFIGDERMDQYQTLMKWAETHEQPIRNVVLEEREIVENEEGWKLVADAVSEE